VVLQNFNGTLVMLDRAGGGGGGFGADEGGGSDFGSSSGGGRVAPARQPALASVGKREDMDDEIPF
jgi:single-strand DNA-binding protein